MRLLLEAGVNKDATTQDVQDGKAALHAALDWAVQTWSLISDRCFWRVCEQLTKMPQHKMARQPGTTGSLGGRDTMAQRMAARQPTMANCQIESGNH